MNLTLWHATRRIAAAPDVVQEVEGVGASRWKGESYMSERCSKADAKYQQCSKHDVVESNDPGWKTSLPITNTDIRVTYVASLSTRYKMRLYSSSSATKIWTFVKCRRGLVVESRVSFQLRRIFASVPTTQVHIKISERRSAANYGYLIKVMTTELGWSRSCRRSNDLYWFSRHSPMRFTAMRFTGLARSRKQKGYLLALSLLAALMCHD